MLCSSRTDTKIQFNESTPFLQSTPDTFIWPANSPTTAVWAGDYANDPNTFDTFYRADGVYETRVIWKKYVEPDGEDGEGEWRVIYDELQTETVDRGERYDHHFHNEFLDLLDDW